MLLKRLSLSRDDWGVNKGKLTGEIEFDNESGSVKIMLNPQHCADIIKIVAGGLVATTREVAATMTADVIEASGVAQLESK